jgi:hypothetical protein
MLIKLIAIAAATLAVSTGAGMAKTDGYVKPVPLQHSMPTNTAGSSSMPTRHELPMRAVVNGHNVQPRGDRLQALGYSDLTPQEAKEVEQLYQQLMQNHLVAKRIFS